MIDTSYNYEELANAIVLQAIKDYKRWRKLEHKLPEMDLTPGLDDKQVQYIKRVRYFGKDALNFLKSDGLKMYTDISGAVLIRIADKQLEDKFKKGADAPINRKELEDEI